MKGRAIKYISKHVAREDLIQITIKLLGLDGGPGSGNFNHAGRPGEVGGSAPGEGMSSASGNAGETNSVSVQNSLPFNKADFDKGLERAKSTDGSQYRFFADYLDGAMYGQGASHDAAYAYSYHGDVLMNNLLRGGKPRYFEQQKEWKKNLKKTKEHIEALTEACNKNVLREPAVVFRGIQTDAGFAKLLGINVDDIAEGYDKSAKIRELVTDPEFAKSIIGQTFSDPAFTSTSIDPETPHKSDFVGPCEMEILLPKGTRGLYFGDMVAITDEHEFLLQRGTQFVITGAEVVAHRKGDRDYHLKLQVTVVDQVPKEVPEKYEDTFPEARPEIEKAIAKGTVLDQRKLEKLFPDADPDILEELSSLKQKNKDGEFHAAEIHKLWELLHLQSELGYITPLQACELEGYVMENSDRLNPSSYERENKEREKKIEDFKSRSEENDVLELRTDVGKMFPEKKDEKHILLMMTHLSEIRRLENRIESDIKQYGEGPIVKGMRRAIEEEKRAMEYISRQ